MGWNKWWTTSKSNQIKFKTAITKYNLCDYSDGHIHVNGAITVPAQDQDTNPNNRNKKVIFENYALFINSVRRIDKKQ